MNLENGGSGGVVQYTHRVISALVEHTDVNVVALLGPTGKGSFDYLQNKRNFREVLFEPSHFFSYIVNIEKIDVVHTPVQYFFNCTFSVPMISTLHDLQHFYYPEFFTKEQIHFRDTYYKKSAEFSERVIVSFDHVKEDLVKFYNIPPERIDVCSLGVKSPEPLEESKLSEIKKKYNLPNKYLFYSANAWRHKNHIRLIKALKIVHEKYGFKIELICTGHQNEDYFPEILKAS